MSRYTRTLTSSQECLIHRIRQLKKTSDALFNQTGSTTNCSGLQVTWKARNRQYLESTEKCQQVFFRSRTMSLDAMSCTLGPLPTSGIRLAELITKGGSENEHMDCEGPGEKNLPRHSSKHPLDLHVQLKLPDLRGHPGQFRRLTK